MPGPRHSGVGLQQTFLEPQNPPVLEVAAEEVAAPPIVVGRHRVTWAAPRRTRPVDRAAWMDDDDGQWIAAPTRRPAQLRSYWRRGRPSFSAPADDEDQQLGWIPVPRGRRQFSTLRPRRGAPFPMVAITAPANPAFIPPARRPRIRPQRQPRNRFVLPPPLIGKCFTWEGGIYGLDFYCLDPLPLVFPRPRSRVTWLRQHRYSPSPFVPPVAATAPPWIPVAHRPAVRFAAPRRSRPAWVALASPTWLPTAVRPRLRSMASRRQRFSPPPFVQPVIVNPDFTAWARRARSFYPPKTRVRTAPVPWGQAPLAPNPSYVSWARRARSFVPPRTRARTTPIPWGQAVTAAIPTWLPIAQARRRLSWLPRRSRAWSAVADVAPPLPVKRLITRSLPRRRSGSVLALTQPPRVPSLKRPSSRGPWLARKRRSQVLPVPAQVPPPPWVVPFYHRTLISRFQLARRIGRWRGWTPGQGSPLPPPTALRFFVDDYEPSPALSTSEPGQQLDDFAPAPLSNSEPQRLLDEVEPPSQLSTRVNSGNA